jgi:hypothetical protein
METTTLVKTIPVTATWEYKLERIELPDLKEGSLRNAELDLSMHGMAGWEVISVPKYDTSHVERQYLLVMMKRPMQN